MKKAVITLTCFLLTVASLTGCGGRVLETIDESKTQIYVSAYSGGYGTEWLNYVKADFEADNPAYQVIVRPTHDEDLIAGNSQLNYDVYFTTTNFAYQGLVSRGVFADLTSVYEATLEGETAPVKDKILDYQSVKESFTYPGKTGIYAIPFTQSFTGFVYDHGIFKENIDNGWLIKASTAEQAAIEADGIVCKVEGNNLVFVSATDSTHYEAGDIILRAGKDGKYGTYDDGQPETLEEWNTLMAIIKLTTNGTAKAITFSDANAYEYTRHIVEGMFAQYEGLENYRIFNTYTGSYRHSAEDTAVAITPQTGYKVYEMEGVEKALSFYYNTVCNADNTAVKIGSTHTEAQEQFLLWNRKTAKDPGSAMLVEGVWWENEARETFNSLGAEYTYGTRDYRYMLLPDVEGQNGIDGNGHGSVFSVQDSGLTLVKASEDTAKVEACKKFVEYSVKNEALRYFTATTGVPRPYKYDLQTEDFAQMTKFQKTVYEIMQDEKNVKLESSTMQSYKSPLGFGTELATYRFSSNIATNAGTVTMQYPINLRDRERVKSLSQWIEGMRGYYQTSWNSMYDKVASFYDAE